MSFQQGLSGLNASSKTLDVIGNNIANANTVGAKATRAEFGDLYSHAMSGTGVNKVGIGVTLASVAQQFTQGNVITTENPLDVAINGTGFFQVANVRRVPNAAADAAPTLDGPPLYGRNGQFKVDRNGFLVNNQQQVLLGYVADVNGNIVPGMAKPLQLPTAGVRPQQTSSIKMEFNVDSRAAVLSRPASNIEFENPLTYNNATSQTVYDEKGQDIALTYYYQKTGADTWDVYATANGKPLLTETVDGAEVPSRIATVHFPSSGANPVNGAPSADGQGARIVSYPGGVVSTDGRITIGVPADEARGTLAIAGIQLDMSAATQFGTPFGVTNLAQNGFAPGQLIGVTIDDTGIITARFSNGQSKAAGQIELANFRNLQGLQPVGGNVWAATFASGDASVGAPGSGNMGLLRAGALEESNIDLTGELVNMITAQRNYQANAQTIKTQDQVMQTIVNLR
ncbi:flagellar hook protein FlgE [Caldimonas tepidiphila]|uniref:flagellar hook protein FlgE n=1 Tax=Caldimonas tepidiphila TaxID=2315841 RepID=UPI000E5A5744|nr:flagellar hook protein FlgE [Caldimonas tepidiphila]